MALLDGLRESKAEKEAANSEDYKIKYMEMAYKEAEKAFEDGDVPIGCVIVNEEGKVVSKAYNRRNYDGSTTSHAEILAFCISRVNFFMVASFCARFYLSTGR